MYPKLFLWWSESSLVIGHNDIQLRRMCLFIDCLSLTVSCRVSFHIWLDFISNLRVFHEHPMILIYWKQLITKTRGMDDWVSYGSCSFFKYLLGVKTDYRHTNTSLAIIEAIHFSFVFLFLCVLNSSTSPVNQNQTRCGQHTKEKNTLSGNEMNRKPHFVTDTCVQFKMEK